MTATGSPATGSPATGSPHLQLNLLDNTFTPRRVRRRKADSQPALFPGSETIGLLRYRACPWVPPADPFRLRVQGLPPPLRLEGTTHDDEDAA